MFNTSMKNLWAIINKHNIHSSKNLLILPLCLSLLLLLFTPNLINIKPVSAPNIIHVPADFQTIQEAIDYATNGDTIEVDAGIYYEHIFINKSITLQGANATTTIIDGASNGTILTLEASNIYITGFTIRNAGTTYSAIASERDRGTNTRHTITNNIIMTSQYGIYLAYSNQNTITNNTISNNFLSGIYLNSADRNDILSNAITESPYGMRLLYSTGNTISGNTISKTSYGIYISDLSTDNIVTLNTVSGQTSGIYVSSDNNIVDHNTITDSAYGIYFFDCTTGTINYNTLTNNSYGIRIYMLTLTTTSHTITNNKAIFNDWAIELTRSIDNTFTGNWLQNNTYGIYLSSSPFNTLYHNNFIQNIMQVYTNADNYWNMSGEGNYWSDYQGEDSDGNGIGDTSYPIIPCYDYHPLMDTWSEHDISIENVTISTNETYFGLTVNITVTVKNKGKITGSETFALTIKYNSTIIETKQIENLAAGETQTIIFGWNTTEIAIGNYTIKAEASIVPDEHNTDNNFFIDGTIKIKILGDVNGDGAVDKYDFSDFAAAYGSSVGNPNYNVQCDFDADGDVDKYDFGTFAGNYGASA